jgi:hypothetical protein
MHHGHDLEGGQFNGKNKLYLTVFVILYYILSRRGPWQTIDESAITCVFERT